MGWQRKKHQMTVELWTKQPEGELVMRGRILRTVVLCTGKTGSSVFSMLDLRDLFGTHVEMLSE